MEGTCLLGESSQEPYLAVNEHMSIYAKQGHWKHGDLKVP